MRITQLTELEDMRLGNITDAGLTNLGGLHNLAELDLSKSQVTGWVRMGWPFMAIWRRSRYSARA